jgi:hypothetical protein
MTVIYINQHEEEILQYAQKINNGLYKKQCISDFISNFELIFPAVSLQNINQGQNLTSNPDLYLLVFSISFSYLIVLHYSIPCSLLAPKAEHLE